MNWLTERMSQMRLSQFAYKRPYQDAVLEKYGFDMVLITPTNKTKFGYEDLDNKDKWIADTVKGFIDFAPKRRIFYHFSWFPDDQDELVLGIFGLNAPVRNDSYIVTRNVEQNSPWGFHVFKIVKVLDYGKWRVLRRDVMMRPVVDNQLYDIFNEIIDSGGMVIGEPRVQN